MFGLFNKNKKKPPSKSREEIMKEAMDNARAAREEIGDETLDKIAAAMKKKEESVTERAKAQIKAMDDEKIADNLRAFLDDK
jgi:hypothetical protein